LLGFIQQFECFSRQQAKQMFYNTSTALHRALVLAQGNKLRYVYCLIMDPSTQRPQISRSYSFRDSALSKVYFKPNLTL